MLSLSWFISLVVIESVNLGMYIIHSATGQKQQQAQQISYLCPVCLLSLSLSPSR
jgi:hypothetical protein